jgi:hypothetical protein
MRNALQSQRARDLRALWRALHQVQTKIGQPYYRTVSAVQKRAETRLRNSPVGKLVQAEAYLTPEGQVALHWWIDAEAWSTARRADGRYLLVTNHLTLSYQRMLALYREKDAVEKRFRDAKQHLKMRPLYVHSDERIQAMLLINMIALLAYSLLERQAQQHGISLTTHRILEQLSTWQVTLVQAWDGSQCWLISDPTPTQLLLLTCIFPAIADRPICLPSGQTPGFLPTALQQACSQLPPPIPFS